MLIKVKLALGLKDLFDLHNIVNLLFKIICKTECSKMYSTKLDSELLLYSNFVQYIKVHAEHISRHHRIKTDRDFMVLLKVHNCNLNVE